MKLSTIIAAVKSYWPWVSKKRLAAVRRRGQTANDEVIDRYEWRLREQRNGYEATLTEEREQSQQLIERLAKVQFGCRRDARKYRVACEVEIDPQMVWCLSQGNDKDVIAFIGRRLAGLVVRELHTINFARLPEVTERLEWPKPLGIVTDRELHERAAR